MKKILELDDLWNIKSTEEACLDLAKRLRAIRRKKGYSQLRFADRSGIPLGTLKIFETKGKISLKHLFEYAKALGLDEELDNLFRTTQLTLEEMRDGQ